mmetsp:Transcript_61277/g.96689  ORF Transcript_61277/g.96689 Transcript_61277/m.96689 type:complete len:211 (-) Transcript_61277:288-920(-)
MRVLGVIVFLAFGSDARRVQATIVEQSSSIQEQMQALLADPSFQQQMQAMLTDPSFQEQMQATLTDPNFQLQVQEIIADPSFQEQAKLLSKQLKEVLADPNFQKEAERIANQIQAMNPRRSLASVLLAGSPALAGKTRSLISAPKVSQHSSGVRRTSSPLCMLDESALSTLSTYLAFNGQEDELIKAAWGALQAFFTFTIAQVCWARNGV